MTPFSGPEPAQLAVGAEPPRERRRGRPAPSSTASPTTSGASARIAATCTSLPRPMVKTRPWPFVAGARAQHHVRGRVVRVRVHRVGAVELARGREAHVAHHQLGDRLGSREVGGRGELKRVKSSIHRGHGTTGTWLCAVGRALLGGLRGGRPRHRRGGVGRGGPLLRRRPAIRPRAGRAPAGRGLQGRSDFVVSTKVGRLVVGRGEGDGQDASQFAGMTEELTLRLHPRRRAALAGSLAGAPRPRPHRRRPRPRPGRAPHGRARRRRSPRCSSCARRAWSAPSARA